MIVADTCVVIWLAKSPDSLSKTATDIIAAARQDRGIVISGASLYEIAWLALRKRIDVGSTIGEFLAHVEATFIVLPITASIAKLAAELPSTYPSDPMDRLIGATALDRGVPLVTPDRAIHKSKAVPAVW